MASAWRQDAPRRVREDRVRLLLVGAGHANVQVLEAFGRKPEPSVDLTLVTPDDRTPYSGMLPGYLAGLYSRTETTIDARNLAKYAGAHFIEDKVIGIDPDARQARLAGGTSLAFDHLALDIGSQPATQAFRYGVPVKPIDRFTDRMDSILAEAKTGEGPLRLAIVGTGAAGVELAFAFAARLPRELGRRPFAIRLVGENREILTGRSPRTRRIVERALSRKGIRTVLGSSVIASDDGRIELADGRSLAADIVVFATSSAPQNWLAGTGLALDPSGFVRVDETLRSLSHPHVHAAGDIASLRQPRPKAGVFAVREGPILAANLRNAILDKSLIAYRPQKDWLNLISMADGRAVADKWGYGLDGKWVWRWKDWNDRRFVDRFNRLAATVS